MNEPFLLSNLIELQELDNEIFKLISQKSEGDTVVKLKSLELDFKKLQNIYKVTDLLSTRALSYEL